MVKTVQQKFSLMSDSLQPGAGFAWHAQRILDPWWVIHLPVYGTFLFNGTQAQAEEMRAHKASWERECAYKRIASFSDFPQPSTCRNHRGYVRAFRPVSLKSKAEFYYRQRFICDCGDCNG